MSKTVYIKGKNNKVTLNDTQFVASGGQGDVYQHSGVIYKIYHKPEEMIPELKIKELKEIKDKRVLIPYDILTNSSGLVIGFTMPYVKNSIPLCKLFTNGFRNKNNVSNQQIIDLIRAMQDVIHRVHDAHCLQIDGNEFNYLVDQNYVTPYFIDIDSYQTPSYPASVIMPTIRDYKSNKFSELTDWFSFAIISFQLFIGIHPFRGGHPNYTNSDLAKRIIDCVSVFNKDVSVPSQARDINATIPQAYRDWYIALFEKGLRLEPPKDIDSHVVKTSANTVIQSSDFEFTLKKQMSSQVLFYGNIYGNCVIKTVDGINLNNRDIPNSKDYEMCFTIKGNVPILVKIENGQLSIKLTTNHKLNYEYPVMCDNIMVLDNYVYAKYEDTIKEIEFSEFQNVIVPNVRKTLNVIPAATEMFSDVIYQNLFRKSYFTIPEPNKNLIHSMFIKELDGYKVIDAKYRKNVCIIIGHKNGVYDRFIIVFNGDFSQYYFRLHKDISYDGINFIALDKGVCVLSNDSSIEMFTNVYDKNMLKVIPNVSFSKFPFVSEGNQLAFIRGNDIIFASMKSQK